MTGALHVYVCMHMYIYVYNPMYFVVHNLVYYAYTHVYTCIIICIHVHVGIYVGLVMDEVHIRFMTSTSGLWWASSTWVTLTTTSSDSSLPSPVMITCLPSPTPCWSSWSGELTFPYAQFACCKLSACLTLCGKQYPDLRDRAFAYSLSPATVH